MNKILEQGKERWTEAREALFEQHSRMREDLNFSNPADPKQWDDTALTTRKGRPCLTFDRTNQFIAQVVNDARQNKPAIHVMPADSGADIEVAKKLNGIIKHIEYTSRASITYDGAIESAARCGLGWMRVVPEILRPETNEQEIRIQRIHDVFSVSLDPNSTEPDGMDAMWGHITTRLTKRAFERLYPKAKLDSFDSDGWFTEDGIRICEEFLIETVKENRITLIDGTTITENEYQGQEILGTFVAKVRKQKWRKFSGCEVLEESEFPSIYVPLVPVIGYEVWIDDKRFICGMTRRLMDSQRAYNYERSAFIESVALQPKAPYLAAAEAVEGHEEDWARLNVGNPSYLPFNAYDDQNRLIPTPMRQQPPAFPVAFAQGGQMATADMESSIGMFKANLGQTSNERSGKAILARQKEGDTANFHYTDNRDRSLEHLGRIIVDMIPRIYDTQRQARIIGEDDKFGFVQIDPKGPPVRKDGKKVISINPSVGHYDVRVKPGPSFSSLRMESAEALGQLLQHAPDLMPVLGDVWVKMQDWPEADKVAQRLKAMLPPELKALEEPEEGEDPTVQIAQQNAQMTQQIQAMEQAGMKLQEDLKACQQDLQKLQSQLMQEQSKRMKAEIDAQRADAMLDVSEAEKQALTNIQSKNEQNQQPSQPSQPQQPMILPDVNGQLASTLGPALDGVAQATQNTAETIQQMVQMQAELANQIAMNQQQVAELMAQISKPRESVVKIEKQKDGSFVGTKVEA